MVLALPKSLTRLQLNLGWNAIKQEAIRKLLDNVFGLQPQVTQIDLCLEYNCSKDLDMKDISEKISEAQKNGQKISIVL